MSDVFSLWNRKLGVGLLLVSLIFMAGWIRSYDVSDSVVVFSSQFWSIEGEILFVPHKMEPGVAMGGPNLMWPIPYWVIVVPMTALSAWFLRKKSTWRR